MSVEFFSETTYLPEELICSWRDSGSQTHDQTDAVELVSAWKAAVVQRIEQLWVEEEE